MYYFKPNEDEVVTKSDCVHPLRPSVVLCILSNSDITKISLLCAIHSKEQVQLALKLEICILHESRRLNRQSAELAVGLSMLFS